MKIKNAAVILMIASICNVLVELANNEMINYKPISWLISLTLPVSLIFVSIALMKFKTGENTSTDNGDTSNTTSNQTMTSDEDKTVAILAYITLIGFIIAIVQHSNNKTKLGAYHLRQVVGFMITGFVMSIILFLIALPIFGMGIRNAVDYSFFIGMFSFVVSIVLLICLIISIINAANGRLKPAPIFGRLFEKRLAKLFN